MQLRGVPPRATRKRIKMMLYGKAKTGKSLFCTQFPKPYYIDTERGVDFDKYVSNIEANNGVVFQTTDYKELLKEIETISTIEHDYQTLVIDSISTIRDNLVDEELQKIESSDKQSKYSQEHQFANLKLKRIYRLLLDIDMHVIITAHSKEKYAADEFKVIGTTGDAHKKSDHLFDLLLETFVSGTKYYSICRGSRLRGLKNNQEIETSYQKFYEHYMKEMEYLKPIPLIVVEDINHVK